MESTSIYQEGLRLGPTRIVSKGRPIREWYDHLRLNTRLPDASIGDLGAQIAAIRTGERRLGQLLDRIGVETYRASCQDISNRHVFSTGRRFGQFPTGSGRGKDILTMTASETNRSRSP